MGLSAIVAAQTAETGALTGTVTDPSGGVIVGATVTITNLATSQTRTATTNENGSYQFSLLPPGSYSVHFEASGFKAADVSPVTVNVTETPTLNRKLEIGSSSEKVTVQANNETIQTESVTNGTVVGSREITSLPLVTRNYTQIVDLSPGVVTNVANASAVGNGTQDVSANGSKANQNNYSMDGASIVDYASGTAGQTGSYPGIAIPNADTIQEFKVQTSQYDAGYGRNPGANVEVITKGGSNEFHGDVWEFNRNNFFNANDFFYKRSELSQGDPNTPQILKQNTFGFTLGGPVKKNKIFFFGSYQGFRQINGIGTTGFATGYASGTNLMPWNDYADFASGVCSDLRCTNNIPAYRAYLGSVFGATGPCPAVISQTSGAPNNCNVGWADGVQVLNNGSNITNTAIAVLQAKGIYKTGYNQGGFYVPSAPPNCQLLTAGQASSGCPTAISLPTHANENQYMANTDWVLSPRNTLSERYLLSSDPQVQTFLCFITPGSCNPGAPENVTYTSHTGTLRLTSTVTNNLINEARFTFQRNIENAVDPNIVMSCDLPNGATIIPLINNGQPCPAVPSPFEEFNIIPIFDVLGLASPSGGWGQGGNFSATGTNIINTFQWGDQVSWSHGIHTVRIGFDGERDLYNNTIPASGRGEVLFDNVADFLTASSGPAIDGTTATGPAGTGGVPVQACGFFGVSYCSGGADPIALRGLLAHYNRINAFDAFVQDDIKVNSKLTVNAGLRWEYNGFPDDKIGQFTNAWANQAALVNTGSFFLADSTNICPSTGAPVGTLAGFVVPKNFDMTAGLTGPCGASGVKINSNKTLVPGSPLDNFAPRLGVAWQPIGSKFVVRAGYGWFYDRLYGSLLVDNQLNLPPYAGTVSGSFPQSLTATLHEPYATVAGTPLTWTPRYLYPTGPFGVNSYLTVLNSSALTYTSDGTALAHHTPLTQEYSLDLQYEVAPGWIADIGYVGTHSTRVYNWSQQINIAHLVSCGAASATCNAPTLPQDMALIANSIPYNDPANTAPVLVNTTENVGARVSYLGYGEGGLATTSPLGDATYNSLQAQIRHNFSHGFLVQASYTWSKELTNIDTAESGSGIQEPGQVTNGASNSNNPLDLGQQYGLASFNRSQRFVVSYSYDLPWKSTAGFSGHVLSGWTISGVTTVQNGQPFTVTDGGGGTIYGAATSRAILADPGRCGSNGVCASAISPTSTGSATDRVINGLNNPTGGGWINLSAFTPFSTITASSPYCVGGVANPGGNPNAPCGALPNPFLPPGAPFYGEGATFAGAGTGFGNSPVGIILGPGQFNWDFSVQKNTKVTEWGTLQFRAEFYNIWNHPQFNPPVSTAIGTTNFGVINSSSVTPRVVQFGLKFLF